MRAAALCSALLLIGCGRIGFEGSHDAGSVDSPAFDGGSPGVRQRLELDRFSASEELDDFPLLVTLTGSRVDGAALGDTSSVRFRDASGVVIPHEVDDHIDNTEARFWVRVPKYIGASTTIYVEYGGTPVAASTDSVWSNRFFGVWHMQDDVAISDSSTNGRTTIAFGNVETVPGLFGQGFEFNPADSDYLQIDGTTGALAGITMSGWMHGSMRSTSPSQHSALITRQFQGSSEDDFWLGLDETEHTSISLTADGTSRTEQGPIVALGEWTHLVGTWDSGSGDTAVYVNGTRVTTATLLASSLDASPHPIFIGAGNNGLNGMPDNADDDFFDGILDEVRLVNTARSPAWIAAEHASETDAAITYGPLERL